MSKGINRILFFNKTIVSAVLFLLCLFGSCDEGSTPPSPANTNANDSIKEIIVEREPVPVDSVLMGKIKMFFAKHLDNSFFSGTILIAKDDNIYFESCKGLGNYKRKTDSIRMTSTFQLASATKPFTSFAILRLISQGKLALTDTVNQILPDFNFKGITVEMLLSHFSGLPNYMYFTDEHWGYTEGSITNHDVLKLFKEHGVKSNGKPNSHFYYNNTNYLVLASIIEHVSHMPYETYMLDSIFLPIGMKNTRIFNNQNRSELVNPTYGHLGDLRPLYYDYLDGVVGDKGMYSNVYDLLKFDQALYDCKLVPKHLLEIAFTPHEKAETHGGSYGLGWRLKSNENFHQIVYHSGWWKGFKSLFIRVPEAHGTIIILSNSVRGSFFHVNELVNLFAE